MALRKAIRARFSPLVTVGVPVLFGAIFGLGSGTVLAAEATWGTLGNFRLAPCTSETCEQPAHVRLKPEESAIAVDANDGGFFVAYKPKEFNGLGPGEHASERMIIAHYASNGQLGAKLELKVPIEEGKKEEGELGTGVEATFDPAENRLYVLVRWEREEPNASSPAPGAQVAGALYAFEYSSEKLASLASKESKPAPILDKDGFKAQGESSKEPLLFPLGLTVDPTTKNVVIVGEQDESSAKEIKEGKEKCRAALQWVKVEETGSKELAGQLARRYVDSGNVLGKAFNEGKSGFESEECGEASEASEWQAYSPVMTATGRLLAMTTSASLSEEGAIWEVPAAYEASGEASTTPKLLYAYPSESREKELELQTGAGEATEATNPTMSLVPDATGEGKLYLDAFYDSKLPVGTPEGASAPSVLALHYKEEAGETKLTELGWVGGYHHFVQKSEEASEIADAACSLPNGQSGGTLGVPTSTAIVGGYKGGGHEGVLEFKTGYQDMLVGLDLGPGGSTGTCLKTELQSPSVNASGAVATGVKVPISSDVIAGVLGSVEWKVAYTTAQGAKGEEEPVKEALSNGLTETTLEHVFHHGGKYVITVKINTFGNLSGPSEQTQTKVVTVASNVKVQLTESPAVAAGEGAAHLEATVTVPGSASGERLKYTWSFGDGSSEGPKETTLNGSHQAHIGAEHVFASRCGGTCHVTLLAESASGEEGAAETAVTVEENKAEREAHKGGGSGGGGGSSAGGASAGTGSGTSTSAATSTSTATGTPQGQVQGLSAVHGNPEAKLASSSLSVSATGSFTIKVTCPAGESSCTGSVTIRTASAVSAGSKKKRSIVTLASGSFSVSGGAAKTVTLHLSAIARSLLARSHSLAGIATLIAHDTTGASRTIAAHVTLRLVAKHKH
jgi:PKD domain